MINWDRLERTIESAEDRRHKPYRCSAGALTCGVGHNIDDRGFSDAVIDLMFKEDLETAVQDAQRIVEKFSLLSDVRKECLIEMAFQLGAVRMMGFRQMLLAINNDDHERAADEMLDSKWAREDTPDRAKRIAAAYRKG